MASPAKSREPGRLRAVKVLLEAGAERRGERVDHDALEDRLGVGQRVARRAADRGEHVVDHLVARRLGRAGLVGRARGVVARLAHADRAAHKVVVAARVEERRADVGRGRRDGQRLAVADRRALGVDGERRVGRAGAGAGRDVERMQAARVDLELVHLADLEVDALDKLAVDLKRRLEALVEEVVVARLGLDRQHKLLVGLGHGRAARLVADQRLGRVEHGANRVLVGRFDAKLVGRLDHLVVEQVEDLGRDRHAGVRRAEVGDRVLVVLRERRLRAREHARLAKERDKLVLEVLQHLGAGGEVDRAGRHLAVEERQQLAVVDNARDDVVDNRRNQLLVGVFELLALLVRVGEERERVLAADRLDARRVSVADLAAHLVAVEKVDRRLNVFRLEERLERVGNRVVENVVLDLGDRHVLVHLGHRRALVRRHGAVEALERLAKERNQAVAQLERGGGVHRVVGQDAEAAAKVVVEAVVGQRVVDHVVDNLAHQLERVGERVDALAVDARVLFARRLLAHHDAVAHVVVNRALVVQLLADQRRRRAPQHRLAVADLQHVRRLHKALVLRRTALAARVACDVERVVARRQHLEAVRAASNQLDHRSFKTVDSVAHCCNGRMQNNV